MATMSLFGGATVTKDSIYDYKVKVNYHIGAGPMTSVLYKPKCCSCSVKNFQLTMATQGGRSYEPS